MDAPPDYTPEQSKVVSETNLFGLIGCVQERILALFDWCCCHRRRRRRYLCSKHIIEFGVAVVEFGVVAVLY